MVRKLNIGDKIKIRPNIHVGKYGINSVVANMVQYAGQTATIENAYDVTRVIKGEKINSREYIIDLDDNYYSWTMEMFNTDFEDDEIIEQVENILGITKEELRQDYITNCSSNNPTEQDLIDYAKDKFKDFL
jgi:hypothetical protein